MYAWNNATVVFNKTRKMYVWYQNRNVIQIAKSVWIRLAYLAKWVLFFKKMPVLTFVRVDSLINRECAGNVLVNVLNVISKKIFALCVKMKRLFIREIVLLVVLKDLKNKDCSVLNRENCKKNRRKMAKVA